ncbi:hypothetical protein NCLIV_015650 [Neospora caninum Liverpool]|uniref:Uncharacterized protein n=1 Tax=Neospora caninum (strain Liverpool) TaxID=572307 RepID=F0VDI0_NEOCL|nr:hypothetical protein NCLIV_015650 [Neospora caninum Liverpool]CBZ51773.1 hypothetical protein NCLIV_015650 [Neospora caninum Liverpool]|eukprot:XP_003881806.1 hypothetical protein NCLIV_015650 [Neospora caninum Liverpool]
MEYDINEKHANCLATGLPPYGQASSNGAPLLLSRSYYAFPISNSVVSPALRSLSVSGSYRRPQNRWSACFCGRYIPLFKTTTHLFDRGTDQKRNAVRLWGISNWLVGSNAAPVRLPWPCMIRLHSSKPYQGEGQGDRKKVVMTHSFPLRTTDKVSHLSTAFVLSSSKQRGGGQTEDRGEVSPVLLDNERIPPLCETGPCPGGRGEQPSAEKMYLMKDRLGHVFGDIMKLKLANSSRPLGRHRMPNSRSNEVNGTSETSVRVRPKTERKKKIVLTTSILGHCTPVLNQAPREDALALSDQLVARLVANEVIKTTVTNARSRIAKRSQGGMDTREKLVSCSGAQCLQKTLANGTCAINQRTNEEMRRDYFSRRRVHSRPNFQEHGKNHWSVTVRMGSRAAVGHQRSEVHDYPIKAVTSPVAFTHRMPVRERATTVYLESEELENLPQTETAAPSARRLEASCSCECHVLPRPYRDGMHTGQCAQVERGDCGLLMNTERKTSSEAGSEEGSWRGGLVSADGQDILDVWPKERDPALEKGLSVESRKEHDETCLENREQLDSDESLRESRSTLQYSHQFGIPTSYLVEELRTLNRLASFLTAYRAIHGRLERRTPPLVLASKEAKSVVVRLINGDTWCHSCNRPARKFNSHRASARNQWTKRKDLYHRTDGNFTLLAARQEGPPDSRARLHCQTVTTCFPGTARASAWIVTPFPGINTRVPSVAPRAPDGAETSAVITAQPDGDKSCPPVQDSRKKQRIKSPALSPFPEPNRFQPVRRSNSVEVSVAGARRPTSEWTAEFSREVESGATQAENQLHRSTENISRKEQDHVESVASLLEGSSLETSSSEINLSRVTHRLTALSKEELLSPHCKAVPKDGSGAPGTVRLNVSGATTAETDGQMPTGNVPESTLVRHRPASVSHIHSFDEARTLGPDPQSFINANRGHLTPAVLRKGEIRYAHEVFFSSEWPSSTVDALDFVNLASTSTRAAGMKSRAPTRGAEFPPPLPGNSAATRSVRGPQSRAEAPGSTRSRGAAVTRDFPRARGPPQRSGSDFALNNLWPCPGRLPHSYRGDTVPRTYSPQRGVPGNILCEDRCRLSISGRDTLDSDSSRHSTGGTGSRDSQHRRRLCSLSARSLFDSHPIGNGKLSLHGRSSVSETASLVAGGTARPESSGKNSVGVGSCTELGTLDNRTLDIRYGLREPPRRHLRTTGTERRQSVFERLYSLRKKPLIGAGLSPQMLRADSRVGGAGKQRFSSVSYRKRGSRPRLRRDSHTDQLHRYPTPCR